MLTHETPVHDIVLIPPRPADEVRGIPASPGRVVRMRELTSTEFEAVVRASNVRGGSGGEASWELVQEGLRRSLVSDGDDPLEYASLVGAQLNTRFSRPRELMILRGAWEELHALSTEDVERVRAVRAW